MNNKSIYIKHIALLSTLLYALIPIAAYSQESETWLEKLDSVVMSVDKYEKDKSDIINVMVAQRDKLRDQKEIYKANCSIYDECCTFDSDLALDIIERNEGIARKMGNQEYIDEWRIKRAFMMSVTGMLMESNSILNSLTTEGMSREMLVSYYTQRIYLNTHYDQYIGAVSANDKYEKDTKAYRDSLEAILTEADADYGWYKTMKIISAGNIDTIKATIDKIIISPNLNSKKDASNAYAIAQIYKKLDDNDKYIKYLAMSSIADLKVANKDIASLEELAGAIYNMHSGDKRTSGLFSNGSDKYIDRAYRYINVCLEGAQKFHNRVRVVSISRVQDNIHSAYVERDREQRESLRVALWTAVGLLLLLAAAIVMVVIMYRKTKVVNNKLENAIDNLKNANNELEESNFVKEEYIGYVFSICSNYIGKIDDYRKNINRKMKVNQHDEVLAMTDKPVVQEEMQKFYKDFDAIFLHIYPDFVKEFNDLLLPEEGIEPKKGELLNTDLRIYALVRLGITDSIKIAELLHCSPQTVYNNRLKIRNKARVPKDTFVDAVQKIGKKSLI
ncbi:MAG: DUF6377 domain-containing protein [Bacteroidales bacterium]|nr:DUF6377 domain-containing protein [Bacteroidales bacterium]